MTAIRDPRLWAGLGLLINCALLAAELFLRSEAQRLRRFPPGKRLVPASGVTAEGRVVPPKVVKVAVDYDWCHLVRYGSKACGFSTADLETFSRLEGELSRRACDTIVLAPAEELLQTSSDVRRVSLAFPSLAFAAAADFTLTPTTLVTDQEWRVIWSKVGALDTGDIPKVVYIVESRRP